MFTIAQAEWISLAILALLMLGMLRIDRFIYFSLLLWRRQSMTPQKDMLRIQAEIADRTYQSWENCWKTLNLSGAAACLLVAFSPLGHRPYAPWVLTSGVLAMIVGATMWSFREKVADWGLAIIHKWEDAEEERVK